MKKRDAQAQGEAAEVTAARVSRTGSIIVALIALAGGGIVGYVGRAARPDPHQNVPERVRHAFLVPFDVYYYYPEESEGFTAALLASQWDQVFFGRQPPSYWNGETMVRIQPARAFIDPDNGKVSHGEIAVSADFHPEDGTVSVYGLGHYSDWLDTQQEGEQRFIRTTWGVTLEVPDRLTAKALMNGQTDVRVLFTLDGAGATTQFEGNITFNARTWIQESEIPLRFVGSDRLSVAANAGIRQVLAQAPVAVVRVGVIRPLGSDEWNQAQP